MVFVIETKIDGMSKWENLYFNLFMMTKHFYVCLVAVVDQLTLTYFKGNNSTRMSKIKNTVPRKIYSNQIFVHSMSGKTRYYFSAIMLQVFFDVADNSNLSAA